MKNNFLLLFLFFLATNAMAIDPVTYESMLPLYDNNRYLGEVRARINGEKVITLERKSLSEALRLRIKTDTLEALSHLPEQIEPKKMPIPLHFNPQDYRLELHARHEQLASQDTILAEDYHVKFGPEAFLPSVFGGAINSRIEQNWTSNSQQESFLTGVFDSFLNLRSVVFENQNYYQSNIDQKFYRGDARIVKDFEKKQIRFQVGDLTPQIQGFMVAKPLGGIGVSRNFNLNPYRLPYSMGSQEFFLESRSMVRYFVNGSLIKSEFLPPGKYTARDIPLFNGLNTIVIEATDDLGQKKVFVFRSAASINLLNVGESRFDVSYGTPIIDQNFKREYTSSEGNLLSSYYQYGFSQSLSASGYAQAQNAFTLLGSELIFATIFGNFGAGSARSQLNGLSGTGHGLSYQWIGDKTFGFRYENREKDFRTSFSDISALVKENYSGSVAIPIADLFTLALGGTYGKVRDNSLSDRYGLDATLNLRVFGKHNLALFLGRARDEFKVWNDVAYAFLTFSLPENNDFVSTFYDIKNKVSKLNYNHDNENRLYRPRLRAALDSDSGGQSGEADVILPTPVAELGARVGAENDLQADKRYSRAALRLNTGLVFAYNEGEWAGGLSRPVPNSFVLFNPEESLKDQKIALKSTSPYTEAERGLFNEITFSNLVAYQYREIQLDPTMMDEGRTLEREKYILYPTYKSAHLITLKNKGSVVVRGVLQKTDGKPWSLAIGRAGDVVFFTNREGEFYIEGIGPGVLSISVDKNSGSENITILKTERGVKDIGILTIPEEE